MNDEYAILAAKTEYREAYNNANVDRLLAVFAPEFTDWSEGEPSFDGKDSQLALRLRTQKLFQIFKVQMQVTIIAVTVKGDFAYDCGSHNIRLTNKNTGETAETRYRYFETWKKQSGTWKIDCIITNKALPPRMLPEVNVPGAAVKTGSQANT